MARRWRWALLPLFWAVVGEAQLLWRILPPGGGKPSYLFGTAHLQDRRVFELPEALPALMASCVVFAPEMDLDERAKAALAEALLLPAGTTLEDLYTPADYAQLEERFRAVTGLELSFFRRFRPVALLLYPMQDTFRRDREESLDEHLRSMALAAGLRVEGLETFEEQMALLESVTPERVLAYFMDADPADLAAEAERVLRLYLDEDIEGMADIGTDPFDRELMVDFRNRRLVRRLMVLMDEGPVFCAVGAAHLGGTNGMVNLLRSEGYGVEPLPRPAFPGEAEVRWERPDRPFAVVWPAEPSSFRSKVDTPIGRFDVLTWTAERGDLLVAVSVSDYPGTVVEMFGEEAVYGAGLEMAAQEVGGRLVSQGRADVAGRRGRQARILFDGDRREILVRLLAHRGRLYVLQAVQPAGADRTAAERFFASFGLR